MPFLRAFARTVLHAALPLAMTAALAGCVTGGETGPSAQNSARDAMAMVPASASTIAFESIDGPPRPVFDRLVQALDSEVQLRDLPVVSREAPAAYRVRGYLSAQIVGKKTAIAWVWDIYDHNQRHVLRLSGVEQATGASRSGAWDAADDMVLRRIAQAGLSGLGRLGGANPEAAPSPAPTPARTAVAALETPLKPLATAALSYDAPSQE